MWSLIAVSRLISKAVTRVHGVSRIAEEVAVKQDDEYFAARAQHERELADRAVAQWVIDMHNRTAEDFERRARACRAKASLGLLGEGKLI